MLVERSRYEEVARKDMLKKVRLFGFIKDHLCHSPPPSPAFVRPRPSYSRHDLRLSQERKRLFFLANKNTVSSYGEANAILTSLFRRMAAAKRQLRKMFLSGKHKTESVPTLVPHENHARAVSLNESHRAFSADNYNHCKHLFKKTGQWLQVHPSVVCTISSEPAFRK